MERLRNKLNYMDDSDFSVTYKLNKLNGIFNWYPYTEGFSKPFVDKMLDFYEAKKNSLVLDPFSGCGTTALSCTLKGIPSISIEVNPFMDFVGKVKNNSLSLDLLKLKQEYKKIINYENNIKNIEIPPFIIGKPFFNIENLHQALIIKEAIIKNITEENYKNFFMLHLASILVRISDMVRAVDLRYKKNKQDKLDVFQIYNDKIVKALNNLSEFKYKERPNQYFFNEDICNVSPAIEKYFGTVDFFITSPPYLNGTNYDRNTKLEMGFLEMIKTDADLKELRTRMIIAGINSTHSKNIYSTDLSFLNELIENVKKNAYDRRIPLMVRGYFNDMDLAIQNIKRLMKNDARGVIVVGDSQFGGNHIETDLILAKICEIHNLEIENINVVRERRSKNGMKLRESLIFVRK